MRVKTYSSFEDLPESYVPLFGDGEAEWYDFSLAWFQNFSKTALDQDDQVCVYGVEQEGGCPRPVAALATRFRPPSFRVFSPAVLSSLSNFYTITFSPICASREERSGEAIDALVKAIARDRHRWDLVELRPLDPRSNVYSNLVRSFKSVGMVTQEYFCFGNWYLPTAGLRFKEYFKTLPSAMQNTIRRKSKKLEKTGQARIEIITGSENLEPAINAYEQIYFSSWKRPEPYPQFVPGLIRACAEKNWLRMGVIYLNDTPIAAQVWIINSGKATIYKLGHDQRYDEFSAGSILTTRLMEHVLDVDKVQEIDFGSGDDAYKKNWLPQRRERWGILAMNPRSLAGCLRIIQNIGGRAAKDAWRKFQANWRAPRSAAAELQKEP